MHPCGNITSLYNQKLKRIAIARKKFMRTMIWNAFTSFILLFVVLLDLIAMQAQQLHLFPKLSYYWIAYNMIFICLGAMAYAYSSKRWLTIYIDYLIPLSAIPVLIKAFSINQDFRYFDKFIDCIWYTGEDYMYAELYEILPWVVSAIIYYILQSLLMYNGGLFLGEVECCQYEIKLYRKIKVDWYPDDYIYNY